jgi:hypothetical protein
MDVSNKKSDCVNAINIIYGNMDQAQVIKGTFTLQDCRNFLEAKNTLLSFFNTEEGYAKQNVFDAFEVFVSGCHKQTASGVFHIEGSVMILNNLELIKKELDESKDPELKILDIKKQYEKARKSKK